MITYLNKQIKTGNYLLMIKKNSLENKQIKASNNI